MKGGTIFGKSTRMRMRHPLMFPSASRVNPEPWVMEMVRRRHGIKRGRRRNIVDSQHDVAQSV